MILEPVRKEIVVETSPERAFQVFAASTWWPKEHTILASGSPRREIVIEPRTGGRWYETGEDGSQCDWGKVLVWDPPRRMVLGWQINGNFEPDASATTEVEVNFVPEAKGTRVMLEHRGFERYAETGQALRDAVGSDNGWGGLLKKFGLAAAGQQPALERYFVCKLITPRPTFMEDMSEAEGAALALHAEYWSGMAETGRAVIFGPVGDPAGVWGLGIITAEDEAQATMIAKGDPVIASGLGFRCEVYPMLRATLAG